MYNLIVDALRQVKDLDFRAPGVRPGICGHVEDLLPETASRQFDEEVRVAYETWSHWSGNYTYPVPPTFVQSMESIGKEQGEQAMWAYLDSGAGGVLWDKTTEYGNLRYMLLDHLIEHFEGLCDE